MTIKFHRPVYDLDIKEGDVRTMDESQEHYYVSHNYANYCPGEEVKDEPKPKKVKK